MSSFFKGLKNEIYKLIRKKKYIVLLIIGLLFCLCNAGIPMLISAVTEGHMTVNSSVILNMLSFTVSVLSPVAAILAASDLISAEFYEDTIKGVMTAPITRAKLLTAKAAAIFILCAIYFGAMYFISLTLQIVSGAGFKNALTGLIAYALDLIPMICVIGLAIFVNLLIGNPGFASVVLIAVYAAFVYMNYFSASVGQNLFTAYMQWHNLLIGTAVPIGAFLSKFGIIAGSGLILFSLSYIMFERRDI